MNPISIFIDANILIAAVASLRGGSYFIFELQAKKKVRLHTVRHALLEAERNIQKKLKNGALLSYYELLEKSSLVIHSISDVSPKEVNLLNELVPPKDIPILIGALRSKCKFLVTLDKKDFVSNKKLKNLTLPFLIVTPGQFLQWLYEQENK